MSADGAMPMPPIERRAPRSDKMSPNMFSVTSDVELPRRPDETQRRRVDIEARRWRHRDTAPRKSRKISRKKAIDGSTFALSTHVTFGARPFRPRRRASAKLASNSRSDPDA